VEEKENLYTILAETFQGKSPLVMGTYRWEDSIQIDLI
jgi:hypothetical protein